MNKLKRILDLVEGYDDPIERGDDFNAYEWSGVKLDVCYQMGYGDGLADMAKDIRDIIAGGAK